MNALNEVRKHERAPNGTRNLVRREAVHPDRASSQSEPLFLTVAEVAALLRTSTKAVYAMAERGQLTGVTRLGRRLLFRRDLLLQWLCQKSNAIAEGEKR